MRRALVGDQQGQQPESDHDPGGGGAHQQAGDGRPLAELCRVRRRERRGNEAGGDGQGEQHDHPQPWVRGDVAGRGAERTEPGRRGGAAAGGGRPSPHPRQDRQAGQDEGRGVEYEDRRQSGDRDDHAAEGVPDRVGDVVDHLRDRGPLHQPPARQHHRHGGQIGAAERRVQQPDQEEQDPQGDQRQPGDRHDEKEERPAEVGGHHDGAPGESVGQTGQ